MRHTRVVVPHYGGPEVITAIEEDIPTPNAGEVRVKVLAAGVSLPDVLERRILRLNRGDSGRGYFVIRFRQEVIRDAQALFAGSA